MREARPWLGFFMGLILGLAIAVVLQQAGVWPLDQLLLFIFVGVFSFIGSLLGRLGRSASSPFSMYAPFVIAVVMIAYGAFGLGDANQMGELNGGCTVDAVSDVDITTVDDTSRGDPFDIDPDGTLSWLATSPVAFMDHTWQIWADVGGFRVPLASGGDPNEGGSQINADEIDDLSGYVAEVTGVESYIAGGAFIVGGDITAGANGCDGFGFVRLIANPFESLASQIAGGLALLALIVLITLLVRGLSGGGGGPAPATASDSMTAEGGTPPSDPSPGEGGFIPPGGTDDDDGTSGRYEPGAEDLPNRDDLA